MTHHDLRSFSLCLYVLVSQQSFVLKMHLSNYKRNILHLIWVVEQDRRAAKNFWGQGRFLQISTQFLNSSIRLNYMKTLQRASFKNSYLCQTKIILADKGKASAFLLGKIKDVMFLFLHHVFNLYFPEAIKR